jgi:hypothetical protein
MIHGTVVSLPGHSCAQDIDAGQNGSEVIGRPPRERKDAAGSE